jgi:YD repeat-containing protein
VNQLDPYGEVTGTVDGWGLTVRSAGVAALAANAGQYTRHMSYSAQGDQTSASTAPLTTTLNGVTTTSTPVTTTHGYNGDRDQTGVTSANGKTTASGYDHLGRPVTKTLPTLTLYTGATVAPTELDPPTRNVSTIHAVSRGDGDGS